MMQRASLFIAGLVLGLAFNTVPGAVERIAGTNVCRESCPPWLTGVSLAIYAAMPLAWWVILASSGGKPRGRKVVLASACASLVLMLSLTWLLYVAQHPAR